MTDTQKTTKTKTGFFVNNNLGTIVNKEKIVFSAERSEPSSLDIYRILTERDRLYRTILLNPSSMYFFTVTPKGAGKIFDDYIEEFKGDLYKIKSLDYTYWIKEIDNTDHLHGVIRVKGLDYKFKKMFSDNYNFRFSRLESLRRVSTYMSKHKPQVMYYLSSQWYSVSIGYENNKKKQVKRFKEIKLI